MTKTYAELIRIADYLERFEYLKIGGSVGRDTFGFDRYMNQMFYKSKEWQDLRNYVIVRDNGCDMAVPGYDIGSRIYIHHINPLRPDDIKHSTDLLLDPNNLVCVSHNTHNAIHYGDFSKLVKMIERTPGDTKLW